MDADSGSRPQEENRRGTPFPQRGAKQELSLSLYATRTPEAVQSVNFLTKRG